MYEPSVYRTRTLEQLFCCYAHETGRVCKEEAAATRRGIEAELRSRINRALFSLQEAQAYEDGEVIFDRFLKGQL